MRHFAVVGSGPAGFYTAEALEKAYGDKARIDILDRYPVPYGLIRFGVAPDHQSLKAVSKRYDKVAESAGVDFIGNVTVGRDVSVAELLDLYDAVDPRDRRAARPQARHSRRRPARSRSARPSSSAGTTAIPISRISTRPLSGSHAAVVGNGNVALDCARILSKTRHEFEGSDIVGHALDALDAFRDPDGHHPRPARPAPDRDDPQGAGRARPPRSCRAGRRARRLPAGRSRRAARAWPSQIRHPASRLCRSCRADKPKRIVFDFFAKPVAIEGEGKAERIIVERTDARRKRRSARHRRDLRGAGVARRHCDRLFDVADRRTCRSMAASSSTRTAALPIGSTRSAGRGAGRPGRSAPTGPTAMKSPTRSPPPCRAGSSADRAGSGGPEAPAREPRRDADRL